MTNIRRVKRCIIIIIIIKKPKNVQNGPELSRLKCTFSASLVLLEHNTVEQQDKKRKSQSVHIRYLQNLNIIRLLSQRSMNKSKFSMFPTLTWLLLAIKCLDEVGHRLSA